MHFVYMHEAHMEKTRWQIKHNKRNIINIDSSAGSDETDVLSEYEILFKDRRQVSLRN